MNSGKSFTHWWETALAPFAEKGSEPWRVRLGKYRDRVRQLFDTRVPGADKWSEGAIEIFGLLSNQEALMNASFLERFARSWAASIRIWSR
jgi:hypothetical protein